MARPGRLEEADDPVVDHSRGGATRDHELTGALR